MRARDGLGQAHIKYDCALAQTELYCASVAVRAEKKATKSVKIRLLFLEFLKRRSKTKNFLSIFCRLPPHPPPRKRRKVRKIFGFCSRDRRERTRRAESERTIQFCFTTHAERAKSLPHFVLEIGASLVQ